MMRRGRVFSTVADVVKLFSFSLLLPLLTALIYEPRDVNVLGASLPWNAFVWLGVFIILTSFWVPVKFLTRETPVDELQDREAYLSVGLGWLTITAFAALPFIFSGVLVQPADAFFEAMSGLTTTGATVLNGQLETVPASVMLWRSLLQFLGGMAIIVLSVAVLARLTQGGLQSLQADAPGASTSRVRSKVLQTAKTLWAVYIGLASILFLILAVLIRRTGISWKSSIFDALIHTFSTLSTGGFSNHAGSIGHYGSWLVEATIIVFMLIAASNFTLIYYTVHGDWRKLVNDPEWRFFLLTFTGVTVVGSGLLWRAKGFAGDLLGSSFREAVFTIASIISSTGYWTIDWDAWPGAGRFAILVLMLTGATAGSTSGGMKHVRILLLLRLIKRQLRMLLHPRAVIPVRLGGRTIKDDTLMAIVGFLFAILTIAIFGCVLVTALEPDVSITEGLSVGAAMVGNTGPALGQFGPAGGYGEMTWASKILLSAMMYLGRLEVFAALLIFNPNSWRH